MENYYYFVILAAIVVGLYGFYRYYAKKSPKLPSVYKVKLLYFDEDAWLCEVNYGEVRDRGFVHIPLEGHYIGEEVEVVKDGAEIFESFVLKSNLKN